MTRRPTHLAARALCWCAALLVLVALARATSPLAALLAASVALNLRQWRRFHTYSGIPQHVIDRIEAQTRRLDERERVLADAVKANTPKP